VTPEPANDPDAELARVGLEYRAATNAAEAPTLKAVAALEQPPAADEPELEDLTHPELAELLVGVATLVAASYDERLVFTEREQARIAKQTERVLRKYLPPDATLPPELALLGTVGLIAGPKLMVPKAETPAGGGPTDAKPEAPPS
jgi:hypothetical protein